MKELKLKNGFIYYFIQKIVILLKYLNLVELFKYISTIFISHKHKEEEKVIRSKNIAIDLFICLKWILTIILFIVSTSILGTFIVIYFLASNLFSYFYYHIWKIEFFNKSENRGRRRLIATVQAILYNILGFSYLYLISFPGYFRWSEGLPSYADSILYSMTNTFLGSSNMYPLSELGVLILIVQYLTTFMFITVILSLSFSNNKK